MAPKRGMSLEDKRSTLLSIFHESKSCFVLKEVEKLGSQRGVVLQSIKDVLQSLVDDDLVNMEKIGASNYFWSFPGEASAKLEGDRLKLTARLEAQRAEEATLRAQLEESRARNDGGEERAELQAAVAALEPDVAGHRAELGRYSENDPDRYEALKQAAVVARDSANRWVDNIQALQSWLRKRFAGSEGAVAELFREHGATDDLDYIDLQENAAPNR